VRIQTEEVKGEKNTKEKRFNGNATRQTRSVGLRKLVKNRVRNSSLLTCVRRERKREVPATKEDGTRNGQYRKMEKKVSGCCNSRGKSVDSNTDKRGLNKTLSRGSKRAKLGKESS